MHTRKQLAEFLRWAADSNTTTAPPDFITDYERDRDGFCWIDTDLYNSLLIEAASALGTHCGLSEDDDLDELDYDILELIEDDITGWEWTLKYHADCPLGDFDVAETIDILSAARTEIENLRQCRKNCHGLDLVKKQQELIESQQHEIKMLREKLLRNAAPVSPPWVTYPRPWWWGTEISSTGVRGNHWASVPDCWEVTYTIEPPALNGGDTK